MLLIISKETILRATYFITLKRVVEQFTI